LLHERSHLNRTLAEGITSYKRDSSVLDLLHGFYCLQVCESDPFRMRAGASGRIVGAKGEDANPAEDTIAAANAPHQAISLDPAIVKMWLEERYPICILDG
jgi:hypothetical protein